MIFEYYKVVLSYVVNWNCSHESEIPLNSPKSPYVITSLWHFFWKSLEILEIFNLWDSISLFKRVFLPYINILESYFKNFSNQQMILRISEIEFTDETFDYIAKRNKSQKLLIDFSKLGWSQCVPCQHILTLKPTTTPLSQTSQNFQFKNPKKSLIICKHQKIIT